jgi:hypothetical protein
MLLLMASMLAVLAAVVVVLQLQRELPVVTVV